MRRIGKILVAVAAVLGSFGGFGDIFGIFSEEAQAACGYGIFAGDFYAPCGRGESDDGKIKVEQGKDGDADVTIITLNNYDGGGVYYAGCGSYGIDSEYFVINLVGENQIVEEEGVGVGLPRVKFVGEGTLTVTAMIPVGGGSLCDYCSVTQGEACRMNWTGIDEDTLKRTLGVTTVTIEPADGVVIGSGNDADTGNEAEDDSSDDSEGSEEGSDGALAGSTEDQTKCDDFGAEDAAIWIAVRIGMIGGFAVILALVVFGAVKASRRGKKGSGGSKGASGGSEGLSGEVEKVSGEAAEGDLGGSGVSEPSKENIDGSVISEAPKEE